MNKKIEIFIEIHIRVWYNSLGNQSTGKRRYEDERFS